MMQPLTKVLKKDFPGSRWGVMIRSKRHVIVVWEIVRIDHLGDSPSSHRVHGEVPVLVRKQAKDFERRARRSPTLVAAAA